MTERSQVRVSLHRRVQSWPSRSRTCVSVWKQYNFVLVEVTHSYGENNYKGSRCLKKTCPVIVVNECNCLLNGQLHASKINSRVMCDFVLKMFFECDVMSGNGLHFN